MDADYLEAEIKITTEEAFALADELVAEVTIGTVGNRILQLGRDYAEKRRYIRRLRAALKVEVAG